MMSLQLAACPASSRPRSSATEPPPAPDASVLPLAAVVDLVDQPAGPAALACARRVLWRAAGPQAHADRLCGRPSPALDLAGRLQALAAAAGGTVQQRRALASALSDFAAHTTLPTQLRLSDAALSDDDWDTVSYLRQAADQMMARGDLQLATADEEGDLGLNRFWQLPALALNEMVYQEMGGARPGPGRPATGASLPGLTLDRVPGHRGLARASRLNDVLAPAMQLDAVGRLRLREATYAVVMGRPLPAALSQAPTCQQLLAQLAGEHPGQPGATLESQAGALAAAERALPAVARSLASLVAQMTLEHRGCFNRALQAVWGDLQAGGDPAGGRALSW